MDKSLRILTVIFIAVFLFPVLAQAEFYLMKYVGQIIWPAFFLLSAIFIPIFLRKFSQNGLSDLATIYYNIMWVIAPFLLLSLISLAWGLHPGAGWDEGLKNIALDFYHWVLLILSITIAQSRTVRKYHRIIFLIVLAGASAAVWVDYFNPGTFSTHKSRSAGFAANANDGARVIVLLCIAAVDWKKNGWQNLIVLSLSGLTVLTTLSVGNILLYLSVVGYYLFLSIMGWAEESFLKKVSLMAAVPLLIIFVIQPLAVNMMESSDALHDRSTQKRLNQISSLFQGDLSFVENHSRKDLVDEYWELIFETPLVGRGTGFSTREGIVGTHNMYLKYWLENGLFGLLIYLSLIAGAFWHFFKLRDKRGLIFSFFFFVSGFHSHNILRDRTIIVLLGILATLAYLENSKKISSLTLGKKSTLQ